MSEEKPPSTTPAPAEGRRPYAPPGIDWQEDFESSANLASACGKIDGQSFQCNTSPAS
jgi:hypothetical protein